MSPGEIASPLRSVLKKHKNTRVLLGEAVDLDATSRELILSDGSVPYDTLLVATGARNSYFGNDGWAAHAPGLKTVEEATALRHKILFAFEAAERETDPEKRTAWLTFVVVGAGPTGVELAGALGEIANETLKDDFRSIRPQDARILLLEGSPRVLPPFAVDLSAKAERELIGLGVRARTNVHVVGIDAEGVDIRTVQGADRIAARTVIWAAGVRASPFGEVLAKRAGAQLDRTGRVLVQADLTVPGHAEILVIGDLAHLRDAASGKPLPGVAQVAMQQGGYAAKLIARRLDDAPAPESFKYFDKGSLAVIGRAAAVAEIGKLHFSGIVAWLIWLFVHLMYLVEFSNRLMVFIHWGFLFVTYNRGARLITGRDELLQRVHMDETSL